MAKSKSMPTVAPDDSKWKAESDARLLAEAAGIKADSTRLKAASKAASEMAKSKMAEAKELKKLGNRPRF